MLNVAVNGVSLAVRDWPGKGPGLVCVHGLTANHTSWESLADALSPDHRMIAYDLRGRGGSDKPSKGYSLEIHAKDLGALLDHFDLPSAVIMGHSLGAALATVASRSLDGDNLAACYTFGSPRVGDKKLDGEIKTPVYRVVNSDDIMTHVPLISMRYQHVGSLFYLTDKSELIRSPSGLLLFMRFWQMLLKRFMSSLENHYIIGYCRKLAKVALLRNPKLPTSKKISETSKKWMSG